MAFGQEIKIAHLGVKQPSKQEVWHFKIWFNPPFL
jgi:hypothetical protein